MNISALWLAPLAFLYGIGTRFRNYLYNIRYRKSFNYQIMVIAVGNLSVGGTGKSPMVEYLVRLLHKAYSLATLSRGYKRKTKGFLIADQYTGVEEIGDEPYQMYLKYHKVAKVAVGEERTLAIPNLLLEHPETQVVIMDDGFQHRAVRPDFSILLTDYNHPFYDDHLLPWGRLREARVGARRAQAVIVTKCPNSLSEDEQGLITERIQAHAGSEMPVFFSKIIYSVPRPLFGNQPFEQGSFVVFSGLANAETFEQHASEKFDIKDSRRFDDHYYYREEDVNGLVELAESYNAALLTTEKDIVKFRDKRLAKLLGRTKLYYLSIEHRFVNSGKIFDELVHNAISKKYKVEE